MAQIFISLANEEKRQSAVTALAKTKHSIMDAPPCDLAEGINAAAARISELKPDVVLMDYWPDDAAGVKLMQTVTDMLDRPEFIFVAPPENVEQSQIIMAFNEGARAYLPEKFRAETLILYIERAITGPGRLRPKTLGNHAHEAIVQYQEEVLGDLRIRSTSQQKLIAYLLATPVNIQSRKTLVVSDSPYQLELLKKMLIEHNFSVLTAASSTDGLNIAMTERPRIIISDLELDGQTGVEFCQTVKLAKKLIPCHFIICTANQDKIAKVMSPGNGVDDCLVKPSSQSDETDFISRVALGLLL